MFIFLFKFKKKKKNFPEIRKTGSTYSKIRQKKHEQFSKKDMSAALGNMK
jgi:hypothetical protein